MKSLTVCLACLCLLAAPCLQAITASYDLIGTVSSSPAVEFPPSSSVLFTISFDADAFDNDTSVDSVDFSFSSFTLTIHPTLYYAGGAFTDTTGAGAFGGVSTEGTGIYLTAMDPGTLTPFGSGTWNPPIVFLDFTYAGDKITDDTPMSSWNLAVGDRLADALHTGTVTIEPTYDTSVTIDISDVTLSSGVIPEPAHAAGVLGLLALAGGWLHRRPS
jgi:MYXO-CTERM domain-containing protein